MAKRWGGEGEKEREEMEETRLGILVDLKEDQYLDSGVRNKSKLSNGRRK